MTLRITRASFEASLKQDMQAIFKGSKIPAAKINKICAETVKDKSDTLSEPSTVRGSGGFPKAASPELKKEVFLKVLRTCEINR